MDFLGGLSKLGHAISTGWNDVFGGDNQDELLKKKQQQQAQAQKAVAPAQNNNPAPASDAPSTNSGLNLYQGPELQKADKPQWDQVTSTPDPNALVKAAQAPPVRQPIVAPKVDIPLEATKEALRGSGAAVAGGIMGVGKSVVGLGQGIIDAPQMINSLGNWASNKLTGQSGGNDMTAPLQKATEIADTPFKALNNKFDESSRFIGPEGTRGERIGDIAGTVATIVPGAAELAGVGLAKLGRTGKATELLQKFGEQAHSPIINDAINGVKGAFNPPKPTNNLAPGVTSANPNQVTDVAAHAAEQAAKDAEAARVAEESARAAQDANRARVQKLQAASDGSPLDTPTYQRNTLNLPAGADRNTMAVPINEGTPEGNLLLNQGKPQLEPTGVELRPAVAPIEPTGRNMDIGNINNPIKEGVIPGTPGVPETMVTTPGRNVTDIYSPRGSASPEMLNQAREQAIAKALGQEGTVMNAPLAKASNSLPSLLARADHPQGTDAQLVDTLNQIILHPEASQELKNAAIAQREGLLRPPAEPVVPPTPIQTPELAAAETPTPVMAPEAPTPVAPAEAPLQGDSFNGPAVRTPGITPAPAEAPAAPRPLDTSASGDNTAPNAPGIRDAQRKELGDIGKTVDATPGRHDILSNPDLDHAAEKVIANMTDDQELIQMYSTGATFNGSADIAQGAAALERLGNLSAAGDVEAGKAIDNILAATEKEASDSGRVLNYVQTFYDKLPRPAKVSYIIRNIDKIREAGGMAKIADSVEVRAELEGRINALLDAAESAKGALAKSEGGMQAIIDGATPGSKSLDKGIISQLETQIASDKLAFEKANGDFAKYYDGLVPQVKGAQKFGDWQRNMMLTSASGRVNDVVTTGINAAHTGAVKGLSGLLGKAVNLVKGPGAVADTAYSPRALIKGVTQGLQKAKGNWQGNVYAADVTKSTSKSNGVDIRTGLPRAKNWLGQKVHAATELATDISSGIKQAELERLGTQEAKQMGFTGADAKLYGRAKASVPSRQAEARGQQLWDEVNNLNDNPVTSALNAVAGVFQGIPKIGPTIRNLTLPFNSWIGGNTFNSIMDRNVIANAVNFARAAAKGDTQGMIDEVAKGTVNGAATFALGYKLTDMGLITNTGPINPNTGKSYNDDGAYIHVGGHYIPAGFLGALAPAIILGNAYHQAVNTEGTPGDKISTGLSQLAFNGLKSLAVTDPLTGNTTLGKTVTTVLSSPDKGGAALATLGGNFAGMNLPALTGDANAALNMTKLNPTHEAADTTVTKTSAAGNQVKDALPSALTSLENRIPFASQTLPRKAGVAAPDFIDRISKGFSDTSASVAAADKVKSIADQAKDFKARNIPDPNGKNFDESVKARIEQGNYDAASEGLQAKLTANQKDNSIAKSTNQKIQDQITTIKVLKDGKFDPSVRDIYSKTSLSEWRNMGDPESDTYDPKTYALLYNYDRNLAGSGVSKSTLSPDKPAYFAAKLGKGSGSTAKSNTLGSTPTFNDISFGKLAPQKVSSPPMPTISSIKPGDLIKQRIISHNKA